MPDNCPSCGVEYVQHLGLNGTCVELLKYKAECDRLRKWADDHEADLTLAYAAGSASRLDEIRALKAERDALAKALWCAEDQWGDDYLWKKWNLSECLTDELKKELSE